MADLETLLAEKANLVAELGRVDSETEFGGRRVKKKSTSEIRSAIAYLDQQIATLRPGRPRRYSAVTGKGL